MEGVEGEGFTVSVSPPWLSQLLMLDSSQEMLFSLV